MQSGNTSIWFRNQMILEISHVHIACTCFHSTTFPEESWTVCNDVHAKRQVCECMSTWDTLQELPTAWQNRKSRGIFLHWESGYQQRRWTCLRFSEASTRIMCKRIIIICRNVQIHALRITNCSLGPQCSTFVRSNLWEANWQLPVHFSESVDLSRELIGLFSKPRCLEFYSKASGAGQRHQTLQPLGYNCLISENWSMDG